MTNEEWLAANPLRQYRERNERSIEWAAERLGVTVQSARGWESGRYRPKGEPRPHGNGTDWVMLAQLIGGNAEADWDAWLASKERTDGA